MQKIEGQMVAGPTWGMALFKDPGNNSLHTLAFHHDAECLCPFWAIEVDPTIAHAVKAELEDVSVDRLAETPTIDNLTCMYARRH